MIITRSTPPPRKYTTTNSFFFYIILRRIRRYMQKVIGTYIILLVFLSTHVSHRTKSFPKVANSWEKSREIFETPINISGECIIMIYRWLCKNKLYSPPSNTHSAHHNDYDIHFFFFLLMVFFVCYGQNISMKIGISISHMRHSTLLTSFRCFFIYKYIVRI